MRLQRAAKIDVGNNLSVNDDKSLVFEKFARVIQRAAGAEDHRLVNIRQPQAKATAIAKRCAHRLWLMMKIDHRFVDALRSQIFSHVTDQRLSQNGQRWFGPVGGQRPEPFAKARSEDHCLHRETILTGSKRRLGRFRRFGVE